MDNISEESTIAPVYARLVLQQLLLAGITPEQVLKGTGLDQDALWSQPEVEVSGFTQLLRNAERLLPARPVGFLIGQHHGILALGTLGVAMGAAPTLRAGLQILDSFTRLHASYIRVEVSSGLEGMTLRLSFLESLGETLRHHMEATLMFIEGYVETLAGKHLDDAHYSLSYPAPAYASTYADYLHSACKFDQQHDVVKLPGHWLQTRSPYFNQGLWEQSQQQLSHRISELGKNDRAAYSKHLRALLRSYEPPLPLLTDVAQRLQLSPRTLNRRLQYEGNSFRQIRNDVLDDWAKQHLEQTSASVEAIAQALGYGDSANFRRAFRKRFGISPGVYRESLAAGKQTTGDKRA
jgi:AraC-like DNA-binding protein